MVDTREVDPIEARLVQLRILHPGDDSCYLDSIELVKWVISGGGQVIFNGPQYDRKAHMVKLVRKGVVYTHASLLPIKISEAGA